MPLDRPIEPTAPAAAPTREALTFEQWHAQWMALPIRGRGDGWKIKFNISSEIGDACRAAFNAGRSTEAAPAEPAEAPETLTAEQIDEQFRVACRAQGWSDFERSGGIYFLAGVQLRWEMFKAGRATSPTALQEGAETLTSFELNGGRAHYLSYLAGMEAAGYGYDDLWEHMLDDEQAIWHSLADRSPTQEPPK